jgi:glycosyltransferase involved in cell wall biosynthesis
MEIARAGATVGAALIVSQPPLVSVVVPCYNQAAFLREAIDSVLAQTYPHREVIVVDDGSTDDTAAVAAGYAGRIRLVRQVNRGLSGARNVGVAHARGTLIGLLDADDRWLPNKLAAEVPRFADSSIGVVHGSYRKFPPTHPRAGDVRKTAGAETTFHEILAFNAVGAPVSAIVRRSDFERVGGFDESLDRGEDWDLWIRIATVARLVGSDAVTAEYRLRDESMSHNYERMYRGLRQMIARHRSHHAGCGACRRAVRRANRQVRAYYFDQAARDAFRARASGNWRRYVALRVRGLVHHPRAAVRIVPGLARRLRLHPA